MQSFFSAKPLSFSLDVVAMGSRIRERILFYNYTKNRF